MSLALYLDDCVFSRKLRRLLIDAGHDVQTPDDVNPSLSGADDILHFAHAKMAGRVILTYNARDFRVLHEDDPSKDMSYFQIVQAIANLESTGVAIAGEFWSLNAYLW